jgi:hypothetical protein
MLGLRMRLTLLGARLADVRSPRTAGGSTGSARPFLGAVVILDCSRAFASALAAAVGSMTTESVSPTETLVAERSPGSMMMKNFPHR